MYLSPAVRRALLVAPFVIVLALPGWSARLRPLGYEEMWNHLQRTNSAVGVTRAAEIDGAEWHATYVDDDFAEFCSGLGLRHVLPALRAPDYVAHVPAGGIHPDARYRVEATTRWPWWWPGGGVDWTAPE
jgi:hypothetical protein